MSGWIKLYRKTLKSDMYKSLNSKQRDVMMALLMMVNHKDQEWEWNGEIFKTKPGQVVTSIAKIKENCASDVSLQSVRTALLKLEKWGFLTNESTKTGRLITIVNWGFYQDDWNETNKDINKELTKHQQRANKELTTNKNEKNVRNKEEKINTLRSRYNSSQLEKIDQYFDCLKHTRKSGKLSQSIIVKEMEYWSRFSVDIVIHSLEIHITKHPDKKEEYTRGIMRRVNEEGIKPFAVPKKKTVDELIQRHRWPLVGG